MNGSKMTFLGLITHGFRRDLRYLDCAPGGNLLCSEGVDEGECKLGQAPVRFRDKCLVPGALCCRTGRTRYIGDNDNAGRALHDS
jgi:hypothetical protein